MSEQTIREATGAEIDELVPILLEAEPSERALRWSLANLADAIYRMDKGGRPVAAATIQWRNDPCEIIELGVAPQHQRQGLGRQMVGWVVGEARRRGKAGVLVGTANSSIGNIVFYQKCGFRMDHIRRDYFWYHREQLSENGLPVRDMLVFRFDLE
jgi:GNAT superfamily N-acetyltransferase